MSLWVAILSSLAHLLSSACTSVIISVSLTSVCSAVQYWLIAIIDVAPTRRQKRYVVRDWKLYKPWVAEKSVLRTITIPHHICALLQTSIFSVSAQNSTHLLMSETSFIHVISFYSHRYGMNTLILDTLIFVCLLIVSHYVLILCTDIVAFPYVCSI